jgi:hypothetical protein
MTKTEKPQSEPKGSCDTSKLCKPIETPNTSVLNKELEEEVEIHNVAELRDFTRQLIEAASNLCPNDVRDYASDFVMAAIIFSQCSDDLKEKKEYIEVYAKTAIYLYMKLYPNGGPICSDDQKHIRIARYVLNAEK